MKLSEIYLLNKEEEVKEVRTNHEEIIAAIDADGGRLTMLALTIIATVCVVLLSTFSILFAEERQGKLCATIITLNGFLLLLHIWRCYLSC